MIFADQTTRLIESSIAWCQGPVLVLVSEVFPYQSIIVCPTVPNIVCHCMCVVIVWLGWSVCKRMVLNIMTRIKSVWKKGKYLLGYDERCDDLDKLCGLSCANFNIL